MDITTLLFDYGGTLDTDGRHWAHVLWDGYRAAAIPVSETQFRTAYVVGERTLAAKPVIQPSDDFHTLLLKKVEIEVEALCAAGAWHATTEERSKAVGEIADFCNNYVLRNLETTRRVLDAVSGGHRLVLVTNFYGNMHAVLRAYNLLRYFSGIIESAVVGVRKPDPAIYRLGLEAAGSRPEETLAVGDSYGKDIVAATSLGCHAVWLRGQGWDNADAERDASIADAVIAHLSELPAQLNGGLLNRPRDRKG